MYFILLEANCRVAAMCFLFQERKEVTEWLKHELSNVGICLLLPMLPLIVVHFLHFSMP